MKRTLLALMFAVAGASGSAQAGSLNGGTVNGGIIINPCLTTLSCIPNNGGGVLTCRFENGTLVCTPVGTNGGTTTNGGTPEVTVDEPGVLQLLGILAVGALSFFLRRRK